MTDELHYTVINVGKFINVCFVVQLYDMSKRVYLSNLAISEMNVDLYREGNTNGLSCHEDIVWQLDFANCI